MLKKNHFLIIHYLDLDMASHCDVLSFSSVKSLKASLKRYMYRKDIHVIFCDNLTSVKIRYHGDHILFSGGEDLGCDK